MMSSCRGGVMTANDDGLITMGEGWGGLKSRKTEDVTYVWPLRVVQVM